MNGIVIQTSDAFSPYYDMLLESARTVRPFCQRNGLQYYGFVGLKRGYLNWHATYNRIFIFNELANSGFDGWALYIDADAYIRDQNFPIAQYLQDRQSAAFIARHTGVTERFFDVNIGVLFVNYGHPYTRPFLQKWLDYFMSYSDDQLRAATEWDTSIHNDQRMFHSLIKDDPNADQSLFAYGDPSIINARKASFIPQVLRVQEPDITLRVTEIRAAVDRALSGND